MALTPKHPYLPDLRYEIIKFQIYREKSFDNKY